MLRFFIQRHDRRMIFITGVMLIMLVVLAGLLGFAFRQMQIHDAAISGIRLALNSTAQLIDDQFRRSYIENQEIAADAMLGLGLEKAGVLESRIDGINLLEQFTGKWMSKPFSAIRIYDSRYVELLDLTHSVQHQDLIVLEKAQDTHTKLTWNGQFNLSHSMMLVNERKQPVGSITTEQPIPALTSFLHDAGLFVGSGQVRLCVTESQPTPNPRCYGYDPDVGQFRALQAPSVDAPFKTISIVNHEQAMRLAQIHPHGNLVSSHFPITGELDVVVTINVLKLIDSLVQPYPEEWWLYLLLVVLSGAIIERCFIKLRNRTPTHPASLFSAVELDQSQLVFPMPLHKNPLAIEWETFFKGMSQVAMMTVIDRSGKIVQVNEKCTEISGFAQEELIGKNYEVLILEKFSASLFRHFTSTIADGDIWHQEMCNRSKTGDSYWIDTVIIPFKQASGDLDAYLLIGIDITACKQSALNSDERIRESNCLQMVQNYMGQDLGLERVCQNILNALVLSLQFPDMAIAMITLGDKRITTANYRDNLSNTISSIIIANGESCGQIQISYIRDLSFTLPFEQNLVNAVAHDLGLWYERKQAESRILQMATHDSLTGLPNRHLLLDRIEQSLLQDVRNNKQMAVLFIDLDHFKTINDSLGHDIGDLLLKGVAERLLVCVRTEDTVARQGGDEFIVVLNTIAESLDAAKVAQKILDTLTQPYYIHSHELHIGGSIGIAVFPQDGVSAETLLRSGDVAMYYAKENGRNNYQFFTDELNKSAREKHMLGLDLRHALERDELVLYYQPVMEMPNTQLNSVEALLRWRHPQHKLIAPDKFISLAEETGLIIPIGEWVLKTVCAQIKAWQSQGFSVPRVAINLSGRQFRDRDLTKNIARILNDMQVDAKYITLEITESMLIDDIEKVVETLKCLSDMGIHISIDDFGTGYSSLSYLKRFPINTLKIDRSFVRDIVTDKNDHTIVAAIIAMAHSLEIKVVAEGIETEEQLRMLEAQGCNYYQGYYFSRPVPVSEIDPFLRRPRINLIHSMRAAN